MARANLFIVGAPKCGTTAWWHYLSQHPDVFMTTPKEPHFFSTDFASFRWVNDRKTYDSLFDGSQEKAVRGEASIMYLYSCEAAEAIATYNPDAKIIICLRDHEKFLEAYHQQLLLNLDEDVTDLEQALDLEPQRRAGRFVPKRCRESKFLLYSRVSTFAPQVQRYLQYFPANQVLILKLEEWIKSPVRAWKDVQEFLEVENSSEVSLEPVNERKGARLQLVSKIYRQPPAVVKAVAGGMRRVGVNTKALSRKLRAFNEPKVSLQGTAHDFSEGLKASFQADASELEKFPRSKFSWPRVSNS